MPKARGTRTPLNRERVLDAGIALADAEGVDALTMRGLGGALGVEAMALYNHINNKEDLLNGMLDRVACEIELPDDTLDWRDYARSRAISAHTVFLRHRWVAALWTARITLGPARMRYMDGALRSLREAGFSPDLLDRTYHAIENHIVGHTLQAMGFPLEPTEMQAIGEQFLRTFPTHQYPDLAAHIQHHLDHTDTDDEFEFGLDLILDGLARMRQHAD